MTQSNQTEATHDAEAQGFTRREMLKLSGLALGGLALGGTMRNLEASTVQHTISTSTGTSSTGPVGPMCKWDNYGKSQRYTYFQQLEPFFPFSDTDPFSGATTTTIPQLGEDELRITFMGSCVPPARRAQQSMSIFVEVGWDKEKQMPLDQFVFDCGGGVSANYAAMNVGFGRMDKVFLAHLHGDHMSDLTYIYCFGPSGDRKSPMYVWGPGPSGVESPPGSGIYYDDGIKAFCTHLRNACRWHTESFSFLATSYADYQMPTRESWGLPSDPLPVADDAPDDAYAMIPVELDWTKYGAVPGDNIAYDNPASGVKITHFPVIHDRKGSIGYKLEWRGLSMIYTSDTKPEIRSLDAAHNDGKGVDVFIHEMAVPAQVWAMKIDRSNIPPDPSSPAVQQTTAVQNSSHTPQGAFGYLMSQMHPKPRLTVATHFPVADDTVECAMKSVQAHCNIVQGRDPKPGEDAARITWSFDLMVITVSKDAIREQRGVVSNFGFGAAIQSLPASQNPPKYHQPGSPVGDPYAQIDTSTEIPAVDPVTGKCNYRQDGY